MVDGRTRQKIERAYKYIEYDLQSLKNFDVDGQLSRSCNNCGQSKFPFRYGICIICGKQNSSIKYIQNDKIVYDGDKDRPDILSDYLNESVDLIDNDL